MNKNHTIIFIVSILLLLSASAGGFFLYYKIEKMKTELSALTQENRNMEAQANRLLTLRKTATLTGSEQDVLDKFFVDNNGALDFVKYIENMAVSSGLTFKIDVFDVQKDEKLLANDKEFLKTAIRTSGTLGNIKIFLNLIETLPYNVKINRVDIRRAGEGNMAWAMTVDFSVVKKIDKPKQ